MTSTAVLDPSLASEPRGDVRPGAVRFLAEAGVACAAGADEDQLATLLMDCFRRGGSREAFEWLARIAYPGLLRRARLRLRACDCGAVGRLDAHEVVQDTFVNVYRYPDRFDATRAIAFRIWSGTILDNVVRRKLRLGRRSGEVALRPAELLEQEPDARRLEPDSQAIEQEAHRAVALAWQLFLALYLDAYRRLSERERFVLQMVEVKGMRYAQLAAMVRLRAEALKMVVFRARRRIFERIAGWLWPQARVGAA
jgi:RNA polymerase sigma factor (sigma-70 family)